MSNINKQLKKNSPLLALGQGINDLLRYEDIAKAGQPVNFTGEGIVQLGALFSQMEIPLEDKEKVEETEDKPENTTTDDGTGDVPDETTGAVVEPPLVVEKTPPGEVIIPRNDIRSDDIKLYANVAADKGQTKKQATEEAVQWYEEQYSKNTGGFGEAVDKVMKETGASFRQVFLNPTKFGVKKNLVKKDTYEGNYVPNSSIRYGEDSTAQSSEPFRNTTILPGDGDNSGYPDAFSAVNRRKSTPYKRLDSSPFARLEQENPKMFEHLSALRYNPNIMGDSPLRRIRHVVASPFLKTDKGPNLEEVDFRYMKRAVMPEYAKGRLGSAAAEGYNLAIDQHNYREAVKKDFEEEVTDQMGDLVKDVDTTNPNYKQDLLALVTEKKKGVADIMAKYRRGDVTKMDVDNYTDTVRADILSIQTASVNSAAGLKDYLQRKDNIDPLASKPMIMDYFNTREKNPQAFTIKSINGVDHYVGKTLQGKDLQIPVSQVADGNAQFRLVPKYNTSKAVKSALAAMKAINVEGMTEFGFGSSNLSPDDPKLKEIGVNQIMMDIGTDESKLRSAMAKYGYNYDIYEQMKGTENPKANIQEMLKDISEEIYKEEVIPSYFQKSKTTKTDNNRLGFGGNKGSGGNGSGGSGGSNTKNNFGAFQVNELFKGGAKEKKEWFRTNIGPKFKYTEGRKNSKGKDISGLLEIPDNNGKYGTPEAQTYDMNREEDVEQLLKIYGSSAGGKGADQFAQQVSEAIESRKNIRKNRTEKIQGQDISKYDFELN